MFKEYSINIADRHFEFLIGPELVNKNTYRSSKHSHEHIEMLYCLKGTLKFATDNEIITLSENDLALILPETRHSVITEKDCYFLFLTFWKNKENDFKETQIIRDFSSPDIFKRLWNYYLSDLKYKEDLIYSCLYELVAILLEHSEATPDISIPVTLENISYRKFVIDQFFNANFNRNTKISELSELLHLSIVQTQRTIKKMYNQTFSQRLSSMRIARAKELLKSTDLTVNEIAVKSGYKSPHNFFKAFKTAKGTTPKKYRIQHKK